MKAYVYSVIVDGVVRYIGKGRGNRLNAHIKNIRSIARRRAAGETVLASHFYNKLTKTWLDGAEILVSVIADGLSDNEAFALETKLIAEAPSGQLWNEALGGQGFNADQWNDPTFREKMQKREASKRTPEYHATRSAIAQSLWDDPQTRERYVSAIWNEARRAKLAEKRRQKEEEKKQRWLPYGSWNEYQAAKAVERKAQRQHERDERAKAGLNRDNGKPLDLSTRFTSERATVVQLNEWRDPEKRKARLKRLGRGSDGRWLGKSEVV